MTTVSLAIMTIVGPIMVLAPLANLSMRCLVAPIREKSGPFAHAVDFEEGNRDAVWDVKTNVATPVFRDDFALALIAPRIS